MAASDAASGFQIGKRKFELLLLCCDLSVSHAAKRGRRENGGEKPPSSISICGMRGLVVTAVAVSVHHVRNVYGFFKEIKVKAVLTLVSLTVS
jgi:hypothetical protein